eukprot:3418120-Prymnesium_polylepis.1
MPNKATAAFESIVSLDAGPKDPGPVGMSKQKSATYRRSSPERHVLLYNSFISHGCDFLLLPHPSLLSAGAPPAVRHPGSDTVSCVSAAMSRPAQAVSHARKRTVLG